MNIERRRRVNPESPEIGPKRQGESAQMLTSFACRGRAIRFAPLAVASLVLLLGPARADAAGSDPFFPAIGDPSYDVGHYDLDLSFNPSKGAINAAETIEATAAHKLSTFGLDLIGLHVSGVTVAGKPAEFSRGKDKLEVTPAEAVPAGQAFTAVVDYQGVPGKFFDANQTAEGWFKTDDGAYTIGEPTGTATWLPCNNVPADKATFTFHVTVPKELTEISNGRLTSEEDKGASRTFTWTEGQPMSTYLAVMDIGRGKLIKSTIDGLQSWSFVDSRLVKRAHKALSEVPGIIRFESRIFGPYPFDSAGSIIDFANDPTNLETQTRPIYLHSPPTTVIVHEIAHQWFGDSVGLATWSDVWLNEGFATWAQWYYAEKHGGKSAAEEFQEFFKPPLNNAGALLPAPAALGSPVYMFGPSVYSRGAMTLEALRMKIGTKPMLQVLRTWAKERRHGSGTTQQFMALAENVSGRNLKALFQRYLFKPTKP